MENNNEWEKRRRRYCINNNVVLKILKRLYNELWLIASAIMFVYILIMFLSSF
jgi:hypothetical protein